MTHLRVDAVGEVDRRTALGKRDHVALRREDEHLGRGQVIAERIQELVRVLGFPLPLQELAQPAEIIRSLLAAHVALLVPPVSGDSELRGPVHVPGPDLQLDRLASGTDDGRVQGLVHVEFRHGDEVLEATRYGAPARVDDAQHRVAVSDRLHQDPNADEVIDVRELTAPDHHFLVDRVEVLGTPGDRRLDASASDVALELVDDTREVLIPRGCPLGHQAFDLVVHLGIEGPEREILKFPLHGVHAQAMCQGGVDLEGFARLLLLLLRRHERQGAHIVKAVGELDDEHANVARHRDHHLAHGFGSGCLAVRDAIELGDAIDEIGHLIAEVLAQLLEGIAGVLDRVVQERSRQGRSRHAELGQDRRHGERVRDVGIS